MRTIRFVIAICFFVVSGWATAGHSQTESLRDKIGQMLMVGFPGLDVPDGIAFDLQGNNLGGVILMGRNLADPSQILDLTTRLKQLAHHPLLIATDQEGGRVARLNSGNGFADSYSHHELGTGFDSEYRTRQMAATMARWLESTGINMNLAPVVDVNVNPQSPAIGRLNRSFSSDPGKVYAHASWFIDEFHRKGIVTTLKHFPGHGSADADSHNGFADVTTTWSEQELQPYERLLEADAVDIIMTGHLFNAGIDSLYPASLSRNTITGLLREQMGYQGVTISDDLYNMRAITDFYGFDEAAVLAINAGVDILLYVGDQVDGQPLVSHLLDLVEQKVDEGVIAESRIDESYRRILDLKRKWFDVTSAEPVIAASPAPVRFELQAYPNPFRLATHIQLAADEATRMSVKVFDVTGREVMRLVEGEKLSRSMTLRLDASTLAPGVYFVRAQTPEHVVTKKITVIR